MGWVWVSLERDKIYPIAVVYRPRQCFYSALGKLYSFTVEGGLESYISELDEG